MLVTTSLDLDAMLLHAAGAAAPATRRRILQGTAVARLALVLAAAFVSIALRDVPIDAVGLLGVVPVVFGVVAIRHRGTRAHLAMTGWPSAVLATFAIGGDDVAAWLVVIRWQPGHTEWPVAVVLAGGAIALPWLMGVLGRRASAGGMANALGAAAPFAQIAVGLSLMAASAVIATS